MHMINVVIVAGKNFAALNIVDQLRSLGYTVTGSATNGQMAIETVAATKPDIVLIDMELGAERTGIEAANQIQTSFGTPVVLIGASVDEATLAEMEAESSATKDKIYDHLSEQAGVPKEEVAEFFGDEQKVEPTIGLILKNLLLLLPL